MDSGEKTSAIASGLNSADGPADSTRANLGDRDPLAHPIRSRRLAGTTKLVLRTVLVTASQPMAAARMLPTFLIAGAARCGTTSMVAALSQHPAVGRPFLPWTREVHFFDNRYYRGLAWYQSHFPFRSRMERAARAVGAKTPQAFESGVYYMFHPLAPERIKRDLPDVKLLVLLRDPVERAFSSYAYSVAAACEMESFERAIDLEESRLVGEVEKIVADPAYHSLSHRHHTYRARGQYIDQLERLERLFGRKRIYVVESSDFFANPASVYRGVLEFLGLPWAGYPVFKHLNARPRPAPMPDSVRAALEEHYRPYNERLARWLGWEPSWCR
jgi:hypothetical protein